jgi:glycosyltransferase involved in cell wall biosynthesis
MAARTMPKFVVYLIFKLEKRLVKGVDFVITAEDTYNDYFKSLGCNSIISILNCKDIATNRYTSPKTEVFTIIYIGVLNRSRFFPENLEVIGNIPNVKFIIAGKKENIYYEIEKLSKKYNNIKFIGSVPYNHVIPYTMNSNLVLCMIKPDDINNRIATANKQFEAMVCGRPIICTKGTRSGKITEHEDCGLVVDYDKTSLKEAIIKLRDSPSLCKKFGKNALKAAINKYNWRLQEKKLLSVYEKLLNII